MLKPSILKSSPMLPEWVGITRSKFRGVHGIGFATWFTRYMFIGCIHSITTFGWLNPLFLMVICWLLNLNPLFLVVIYCNFSMFLMGVFSLYPYGIHIWVEMLKSPCMLVDIRSVHPQLLTKSIQIKIGLNNWSLYIYICVILYVYLPFTPPFWLVKSVQHSSATS